MEDAAFYRMVGGIVIYAFLWLLANATLGFFCWWLADRKGYNGAAWFFLTVLFSVMAFFTMVGAPTKTTVTLSTLAARPEPIHQPPSQAVANTLEREAALKSGNSWFKPIVFGLVLFAILLILMDQFLGK